MSITAARAVGASEKKTEKRSLLAVTLVRAVDRGGVTRSLQVLECTCFTGIKVQILAVTLVRAVDRGGVTRSLQVLECTCFTGTKVQMLTQVQEEAEAASTQLQYAFVLVYLLYC